MPRPWSRVYRRGIRHRVERRHPYVEHTVERRQVGDPRPVVTDRDSRALGIAEQRLPGNQLSLVFFHASPSRSTRAPREVRV